MAELNSIIRNAIYTALYAYHNEKHSKAAVRCVNFHLMSIPKYWEEPELLAGFRGSRE